jgi:hypothetical protein
VTVAALVLGILGTIFSLIPGLFFVGVPLALLGLILGVVGRKQAATEGQPTGMGTAGVVLGVIGLAIGVSMWVLCSMCTNSARKSWEKAVNDPEFKKQFGDEKVKADFDKAFQDAIDDAKKKAQEKRQQDEAKQQTGAPPPPAPQPPR